MLILIYSETNQTNIRENLGKPEYSYYFVLKEFRPVLERLGRVMEISTPDELVDRIYDDCQRRGEDCVFLSFSPPHRTPIHYRCPTIPVFAWEFSAIPYESWHGEPRHDWRLVFSRLGAAITHSSFTVDSVHQAMGPDFPVISIPAPVWERFAPMAERLQRRPMAKQLELQVDGLVIDSRVDDVGGYAPEPHRSAPRIDFDTSRRHQTLRLDGVIYTSVFNPFDGRKNWVDMLGAFCWAFRECEDATLVLKLTHHCIDDALADMLHHLYKLKPYRCRFVIIHGYLEDADYERLVESTSYVVNTSYGEGQCLPLMEFMSSGKPAIAPRNTAMLDYVSADNAFVVECTEELTAWPHDPRAAYRTLRYITNWDSLLEAYRQSYQVAKEDADRYARMSEAATASLKTFCSLEQAERQLAAFLNETLERQSQSAPATATPPCPPT